MLLVHEGKRSKDKNKERMIARQRDFRCAQTEKTIKRSKNEERRTERLYMYTDIESAHYTLAQTIDLPSNRSMAQTEKVLCISLSLLLR